MRTWLVNLSVTVDDKGALELHALVGTDPSSSMTGTIDVEVEAESVDEAIVEALERATAMARLRLTG